MYIWDVPRKKLSPEKLRFAKEVGRTKNVKLAAMAALPIRQDEFPHQVEDRGRRLIRENKEIRKTVLEVWEAEGLTLSLAAKQHKKVLMSKKSRGADTLKAADMVYRGHGLKTSVDPGDGPAVNPMIQIFLQQRKERGLEIPEGIVEAEVVEEG